MAAICFVHNVSQIIIHIHVIKINLSDQKNKMTPEVQSEFLEQLALAS